MADRILTTHVGSLPRPAELLPYIRGDKPAPTDFPMQLASATGDVFAKQLEAGIDIVNDGEFGRRGYVTAARNRMSGFDSQKQATGASDLEEMKEYSDKFEGRKGLLTLTKKTEVKNAACSGPIKYTDAGLADLKEEINRVVASAKAKGIPLENVFLSSPSPGTPANFFEDDYFKDHTKYVEALGAAMQREYEAIYHSGLTLQVDCPDLAMGRHTKFKEGSLDAFRAAATVHVRVMNKALANVPAERARMHVCWGNYPGPHHHDVPLGNVIDIVLDSKPKFLSIEACNPGHAHEWEVFRSVKWPANKVLMPGVLDTTTSHIEHPRLVAQRLMNYVRLIGAKNVIACTDCGFSTAAGAMNVPTEIVYAKMQSMVKGAGIASEMARKEGVVSPPRSSCLSGLHAFLFGKATA
nr:B12-independent methionine synthase [Margalefidinium polykrikoides]